MLVFATDPDVGTFAAVSWELKKPGGNKLVVIRSLGGEHHSLNVSCCPGMVLPVVQTIRSVCRVRVN